ncbi:MAG: hypothetical protein KJ052_21360, partial [Candidatus Hydrogenedentes bacterium]|nr:hypothetical protein [Candidatus Hydrogenedentota bacterium]
VALSLVGPRSILFMGLFSFVIYALLLMYLARKKSEAFWMMLLFLPALLITFKHGFTRQDGHVLYYFPFLLSVLSFLLLVSLSLNEWRAVLFTFFIVQLLALPVALNYGVPYFADAVDLLSGKRAIDNLGNLLRLPATRERLAEESHENLRARRLPDPWLERIRGDGGTVDVFPWELNYIPANGLTWQPSPLLQGYLILTQSLDQRTAGHLSGSYAPDFLLVHFEDIDGRNLILDAPATWRAIRANYDILDRREKLFLLQKAGSGPQMTEFTPVASLAVEGSKWLDVPAVNAEPYLFMDMRLSWLGQLRKSLFRIPAVMIECNYRNDLPQSFRITPNTAANGLALGATPRTADEFALWFEGSLKNEVTHFRFYEAGGFQHYRSPISAQWRILE